MTGTGRGKGRGRGCVAESLAAGRRVPSVESGDAREGGRKTELEGALDALPSVIPRASCCHLGPGPAM